MRVYLDNAATTPLSEEVIEEMVKVMREDFGNPSSIHGDGRKVRAALEDARKRVANHIGASIGEIFFTSGGTESNNMAIKCAVRDLGVRRVITSPIEHHCVLHSIERMEEQGVEMIQLSVDQYGVIDYYQLEQLLSGSTVPTLVCLMHANNEIGVLLDMQRVSDLCQEHGAYFHSDTVQTMGHFPIDVSKLYIHFLSGAAHKFHGPKGVGFIYVNGDSSIAPLLDGGSQERNMRAGTENVYGIIGLAKAMDLAYADLDSRRAHIITLRDRMKQGLQEMVEGVRFLEQPDADYLYTVLNVSFPENDRTSLLLFNLDIAGISASGGSACSSGADAGSHVVRALNQPEGRVNIRFSFSHYNSAEEIDWVIKQLANILELSPMVG